MDASATAIASVTSVRWATGAAQWATEHLGKDKDAWERLVFMFAQREQLPALGRHVPVSPRLSQLAYTAVASAYVPLEHNHAELAQLLHRWPQSLLNDIADEVTQIIYHRIKQGSDSPSVDLQRALARLLDIQARIVASLCSAYLSSQYSTVSGSHYWVLVRNSSRLGGSITFPTLELSSWCQTHTPTLKTHWAGL